MNFLLSLKSIIKFFYRNIHVHELIYCTNVFVAECFGCFKMSLNVEKTNTLLIFTVFFVICKMKKNIRMFDLFNHHRSPSVAFQDLNKFHKVHI